jgi:hypothetical protein
MPTDKFIVVRCDGRTPREVIVSKETPCPVMFLDVKVGKETVHIPGYLIPDGPVAARLCVENSDRYRLYKSGPLMHRVNGKFETANPYTFAVVREETGVDKENGEAIFEEKIKWIEDKAGISIEKGPVTEATFLGGEKSAPAFDAKVDSSAALAKAEKALAEISELKATIDTLIWKLKPFIGDEPEPETPKKGGKSGK